MGLRTRDALGDLDSSELLFLAFLVDSGTGYLALCFTRTPAWLILVPLEHCTRCILLFPFETESRSYSTCKRKLYDRYIIAS